MFLFGLTGSIASGKSTVSAYLAGLGCPVIDADKIARDVVKPGQPAWKEIVTHFGQDVLHSSGEVNRAALRDLIFNDSQKRQLLNRCTHPHIQQTMLWQALWHFLKGEKFVVLDTPLLFESGGLIAWMKKVVVVYCSQDQQCSRLMKRDHVTEEEARKRIASQIPLEEKVLRADLVIDNSQDMEKTKKQVQHLYQHFRKLSWWCGLYTWIVTLSLLLIVVLYVY